MQLCAAKASESYSTLAHSLTTKTKMNYASRKNQLKTLSYKNKLEKDIEIQTYPPSVKPCLRKPSIAGAPNWLSTFNDLVLRDRGCEMFIENAATVVVGKSSSLPYELKLAKLHKAIS